MSWQHYIDNQMLAAGCMYATIIGHDGSKWASSPGFEIASTESETLVNALNDAANFTTVTAAGFTVASQKYAFIRGEADDDDGGAAYLQGRCKEDGKNSQGVIIYKTTQSLLIGVHDPAYSNGASFNKVNSDLGRIADYMIETGY